MADYDRRLREKQKTNIDYANGKAYIFRDESESESYDMEAGHSDIEREEFVSGWHAEREDEEEALIRREQRKKRKWKQLKALGQDI